MADREARAGSPREAGAPELFISRASTGQPVKEAGQAPASLRCWGIRGCRRPSRAALLHAIPASCPAILYVTSACSHSPLKPAGRQGLTSSCPSSAERREEVKSDESHGGQPTAPRASEGQGNTLPSCCEVGPLGAPQVSSRGAETPAEPFPAHCQGGASRFQVMEQGWGQDLQQVPAHQEPVQLDPQLAEEGWWLASRASALGDTPAGLPLSMPPSLLILLWALPHQWNSPHGTPGTPAGMPLPVKAGDKKDCCLQPLSLVCGLLSDDSS